MSFDTNFKTSTQNIKPYEDLQFLVEYKLAKFLIVSKSNSYYKYFLETQQQNVFRVTILNESLVNSSHNMTRSKIPI